MARVPVLGAKILFGTRYTWRELLAGGALYFIARWVYFNSQNIWWIGIVVAVLAAKDIPLCRPLQVYLPAAVPPWRWCWHCTLPGSLPRT